MDPCALHLYPWIKLPQYKMDGGDVPKVCFFAWKNGGSWMQIHYQVTKW
jgi:hypothetical protein